MFARLENNIVVEILNASALPSFHPDLIWVACDENTQEGMIHDNGSFLPADSLLSDEEKRALLIDHASLLRRVVDDQILNIGGIEMRGDETTRNAITETLVFLETQQAGTTIDWQAENGFFAVDYDGLKALGLAIAARRQQSFSIKKSILADIDAGTITTTDQIDTAFEQGLL